MKAKMIIEQEIDLDIVKITLLPKGIYLKAYRFIPKTHWWWLQTRRCKDWGYVPAVNIKGNVKTLFIDETYVAVRPALKIRNLKSYGLNTGDIIELAGYKWIVILDEYALCSELVGKTCFNTCFNEVESQDAHKYSKSDIKVWIDNWATEKGIVVNDVKK